MTMCAGSHKTETGATRREYRLIAAGFGGQGSLTIGRLLCAAAIGEGRNVTYLPSYGSEVRGGTANCQVVISAGTIYSPLVEEADGLIILNQLSCERFAPRLKAGGLMVLNSSAVELPEEPVRTDGTVLAVPAGELAAELGDVRVANIVMLGTFVRASGILGEQSVRAAIERVLGARKAEMAELNARAWQKGLELAGARA